MYEADSPTALALFRSKNSATEERADSGALLLTLYEPGVACGQVSSGFIDTLAKTHFTFQVPKYSLFSWLNRRQLCLTFKEYKLLLSSGT